MHLPRPVEHQLVRVVLWHERQPRALQLGTVAPVDNLSLEGHTRPCSEFALDGLLLDRLSPLTPLRVRVKDVVDDTLRVVSVLTDRLSNRGSTSCITKSVNNLLHNCAIHLVLAAMLGLVRSISIKCGEQVGERGRHKSIKEVRRVRLEVLLHLLVARQDRHDAQLNL